MSGVTQSFVVLFQCSNVDISSVLMFQSLYVDSKKKAEDYGISNSYQVMGEIGEATRHFLSDAKVGAGIMHTTSSPLTHSIETISH